MPKNKLKPNQQCSTCPFLKNTTVSQIPDYDPEDHEALRAITLDEGHETDYQNLAVPVRVMACHHRHQGLCIGWAFNQREIRNIGFLLNCARGLHEESFPLETAGEQVETFEQTFK